MIPPAPPRFCRRLRPRQAREGNSGGAYCPAPVSPLAQCGRVLPNPTTVGSADPLRRSADLKERDGKIVGRERNGRAVDQRCGAPWVFFFPSLNALGNAACLQAAAPEAVSRRNSLPPLNATASVQVLKSVKCVWRKRARVVLRHRKGRPRRRGEVAAVHLRRQRRTVVQVLKSVKCVWRKRALAQRRLRKMS